MASLKSKQRQLEFSKFIIYSDNYVNFVFRHYHSSRNTCHQTPLLGYPKSYFFVLIETYIYSKKIQRVKTRLILMHGWSSVVLVAPGPVPNAGDGRRGNEHNGSIVDCLGGDGDDSRHAKERHSKQRPGCETYQVSHLA